LAGKYLRLAGIGLLHLAALLALVSLDIDAGGRSEVNPLSAIAVAVVAIGMLKASESELR